MDVRHDETPKDTKGQFPVQQLVQHPPTLEVLRKLDRNIEQDWFRAAFRAQVFIGLKRRRLAAMEPRDLWEHPDGRWFAFNRQVPLVIRDEIVDFMWGQRPIFGDWLTERFVREALKKASKRSGVSPWVRWLQLGHCDRETKNAFERYLIERRHSNEVVETQPRNLTSFDLTTNESE